MFFTFSKFALLILSFGISSSSPTYYALQAEDVVSIYISVSSKKKCANQILSIDGKKICVAAAPVITRHDFSHVSKIKVDLANQQYFSIVFTETGVLKLKNIALAFPNTQVVLVVENNAVGFLTDLEKLNSSALKMTNTKEANINFELIHGKLKKFLPEHN